MPAPRKNPASGTSLKSTTGRLLGLPVRRALCCSNCYCPTRAILLVPKNSKTNARRLLSKLIRDFGKNDTELRDALKKFIGDFGNWEYAANPAYLEVGRGLVKAAHGEDAPLVVDPFAGGGSIPLEALRLGCDVFASDLNPVSCLILKVVLEDIPRYRSSLADELRESCDEIKRQAEKELTQYYPPDSEGAAPITYLWARTVRCESPNCGAEIPLVRSFWLCKKTSRMRALRYQVKRSKGKPPYVEFEVFTPDSEKDIPPGTVSHAKATCIACKERGAGGVLAPERVRAQLREYRGGAEVIFDITGNRIGRDDEQAPLKLANKNERKTAERARLGIDALEKKQVLLQTPNAALLEASLNKIRGFYSNAYGWEVTAADVGEITAAKSMRQYIKSWITAWDLERLYNSRPEIETVAVAPDYEENKDIEIVAEPSGDDPDGE